jgi:hypothetical protein
MIQLMIPARVVQMKGTDFGTPGWILEKAIPSESNGIKIRELDKICGFSYSITLAACSELSRKYTHATASSD